MATTHSAAHYGHPRAKAGIRAVTAVLAALAFSGTAAGYVATDAHADTIPAAHPVASPMEDQAAMAAFNTQFGIATAVGGFGGTVVGAGVGCLIGAGIVAVPTVLMATPVGCLAGAAAGAPIGGIIGTIGVGGPALALAGSDMLSTLTAAPGTTKWAQR